MSDIKRYRVSFEVNSHPDYSNNWAEYGSFSENYMELERESRFITVPSDAVIEDITPVPEISFPDGTLLRANDGLLEVRDGGKWYYSHNNSAWILDSWTDADAQSWLDSGNYTLLHKPES